MKRNKKMLIVCHCLMNCNSKVEGLSLFEGVHPVVKELIGKDFGIIQLPCPELIMYGMRRWGHVKDQFDTLFFRKNCREMLEPYMYQLDEYLKNGYDIKAILAVDGSPSCGYNFTCRSNKWFGSDNMRNPDILNSIEMVNEKGVFIEELIKLLDEYGFGIPIIGIDETKEEEFQDIIDKIE